MEHKIEDLQESIEGLKTTTLDPRHSFSINEPVKQADFHLDFEMKGVLRRFTPREDLTTVELSKIITFILSSSLGGRFFDSTYFIEQNNLERHFTIISQPKNSETGEVDEKDLYMKTGYCNDGNN